MGRSGGPPEVIVLSDSSDSDSFSDRAPLTFRHSRLRKVIVLSDSDNSDCIRDVGPTSPGGMFVGLASDGGVDEQLYGSDG